MQWLPYEFFFEGSIATAAQQPRAKGKVGRKGAYYRGACPTHTLGNFENVGNKIPLRKKNHTANVYRELQGPCRKNLQYLWKRAVRIAEKPYTPQRERLHILWRNPVIFTDCGETP